MIGLCNLLMTITLVKFIGNKIYYYEVGPKPVRKVLFFPQLPNDKFFLFLQIKTVIKVMNNFYGFGLCFICRLISLPHGSALTMVIITRVSDVLSLCFISLSPFLSLCLPHFIDHIIKDVTYDCEKNSSRKRRKRTIRERISIHLMQEGRSWKMLASLIFHLKNKPE